MTSNFTKELDSYEDNTGKPVKGQYHFQPPHDLEPNAYNMHIDYESHDEANPDAFQYDGYLVVGHRPYLVGQPIIVPFLTTAISEDAITAYEKRSTTFTSVLKAFSDSDHTKVIKNLPYLLRIKKGMFKDYQKTDNHTELVDDFNTASRFLESSQPYYTDNNGTSSKSFKVGDLFGSTEAITNVNTLLYRCKGTRNRGTDNYVPGTGVAPLIIGSTDVRLFVSSNQDVTEEVWGSTQKVIHVCGYGSCIISCDIKYDFAYNSDGSVKVGYENYHNNLNYFVKVGALKLQVKRSSNHDWEDIPKSQITPANENTTIDNKGVITQTSGKEKGSVQIVYTNNFPYETDALVQLRFVYTGKPGYTLSSTSYNKHMKLHPDYATSGKIPTVLNVGNLNLLRGQDNTIQVNASLRVNGENKTSNSLAGELRYDWGDKDYTVRVSANGSARVTLPKGVYDDYLHLQYIPDDSKLAQYANAYTPTFSKQNVTLEISNQRERKLNRANDLYVGGQLYPLTDYTEDKDHRHLLTIKGAMTDVPVTGGSLKVYLVRKSSTSELTRDCPKALLETIPLNGSTTSIKLPNFNTYFMDELFTQTEWVNKESKFNSYSLYVEYTGNLDFYSKSVDGKIGKFIYNATNITQRLFTPSRTLTQNDTLVYAPGETLNLTFEMKGKAETNFDKTSTAGISNVSISNVKTNVTFYDYDNDITLEDGTVIPAGSPIDIPTNTNSDKRVAGMKVTNEGRTDENGRVTWTWKLPTTGSWLTRENCKLVFTIQEKAAIERGTNPLEYTLNFKIHKKNVVLSIPDGWPEIKLSNKSGDYVDGDIIEDKKHHLNVYYYDNNSTSPLDDSVPKRPVDSGSLNVDIVCGTKIDGEFEELFSERFDSISLNGTQTVFNIPTLSQGDMRYFLRNVPVDPIFTSYYLKVEYVGNSSYNSATYFENKPKILYPLEDVLYSYNCSVNNGGTVSTDTDITYSINTVHAYEDILFIKGDLPARPYGIKTNLTIKPHKNIVLPDKTLKAGITYDLPIGEYVSVTNQGLLNWGGNATWTFHVPPGNTWSGADFDLTLTVATKATIVLDSTCKTSHTTRIKIA